MIWLRRTFCILCITALLVACGKNDRQLSEAKQLLTKIQEILRKALPTSPTPPALTTLVDRCVLLQSLSVSSDPNICGSEGLYHLITQSGRSADVKALKFELTEEQKISIISVAQHDLAQIKISYARSLLNEYWNQRRHFEIIARSIQEVVASASPGDTSALLGDPVTLLPIAERQQAAAYVEATRQSLSMVSAVVPTELNTTTLGDMEKFAGRLRQPERELPATNENVLRAVDNERLTDRLRWLQEVDGAASLPSRSEAWLEIPAVSPSGPLWHDVVDRQWRLSEAIERATVPSGSTSANVAFIDRATSEQLVGDCTALWELDPTRAQTVCGNNPALDWAREYLGSAGRKAGGDASGPQASPSPPPPSGPARPSTNVGLPRDVFQPQEHPDQGYDLAGELEARIRLVSRNFAEAWALDQWRVHIQAQARLVTLYRAIERAIAPKARHLLPASALGLLSEATLKERRTYYERHHRIARILASEFLVPIATHTEQSCAHEISIIDQAMEMRAKTEFATIAQHLDPDKFKLAMAEYDTALKTEISRQREILASALPALRAEIMDPVRPRPPPITDPLHPQSARILAMIEDTDPLTQLDAETSLRAEFEKLRLLPESEQATINFTKGTTFEQWALAELNDPDLARAVAHVGQYIRLANEDELHVLTQQDVRRQNLKVILKTEILRRDQERTSGLERYPTDRIPSLNQDLDGQLNDTPGQLLRENWFLRLSEYRWNDPTAMPSGVRARAGAIYRKRFDEDFRKLKELEERARKQQDIMVRASDPLTLDEQRTVRSVRDGLARLSQMLRQRYDFAVQKALFSNEPSLRDTLSTWWTIYKGKGDGPDLGPAPANPQPQPPAPSSPPAIAAENDNIAGAQQGLPSIRGPPNADEKHRPAALPGQRDGPDLGSAPANPQPQPPAPSSPPAIAAANDNIYDVVQGGPGIRGPPDLQPFTARLAGSDPLWTRLLLDNRNSLAQLESRIADTQVISQNLAGSTLPPTYARDKGRAIVDEPGAKIGTSRRPFAIPTMTFSSEPRLPERLDWVGWTKPKQKDSVAELYDFKTEVVEPKTRAPVGGGIHFGNTAVACPALGDLTRYVLRYDASSRRLFLEAPDQPHLILPAVDPQTLKALWRFVSADDGKRNMAISIGWIGRERQSVASKESPILLDPFLADTSVGRDLFLADSIPWSLNQADLPNGRTNPIHPAFAKRLQQRHDQFKQKLSKLAERIAARLAGPSEPAALSERAGFTQSSTYFNDAMMIAVLDSTSPEERVEILKRVTQLDSITQTLTSLKSELEIIGMFSTRPGRGALGRLRRNSPFLDDEMYNSLRRHGSDADDLRNVRRRQAAQEAAIRHDIETLESNIQVIDEWILDLRELPNAKIQAIANLLWYYTSESVIPWRAIFGFSIVLHEQDPKISSEGLAALMLNVLDRTGGLSVLLDKEPPTICIEGNQLTLKGEMSYMYLDDYWDVEPNGLALFLRGADGRTDRATTIQHDEVLEKIVNSNIEALARHLPQLTRVMEDARLAAFLRWSREPGHLAGIDFTDLTAIAGHDRTNTPTPDAERRE